MKRLNLALLALVAVLGSGCGGIQASKSFSPLDFILPGLLQTDPPVPVSPADTNAAPVLASDSRAPSLTHN